MKHVSKVLALSLSAMIGATAPVSAFDWPDSHTRTIILDNLCDRTLDVLVTYSPRKDVWEKAGWFTLEPGLRTFPRHDGERLKHRDRASALIYARSPNGSFELKGDHGTNFGGEHYKSYTANRFFRGQFLELRLKC